MFYVIFMKPASHLKNLSRHNYVLWLGYLLVLDTGGQFNFQLFQLNKIIGFFWVLYEKTFTTYPIQNIRPAKIHFYTLLPSTMCSKPAGNRNEKKVESMIKF